MTRDEFYEHMRAASEGAAILGDVNRIEAANKETFSNAADLLLARGVLTEHRQDAVDAKGKPKERERVLVPADSPLPLERLR